MPHSRRDDDEEESSAPTARSGDVISRWLDATPVLMLALTGHIGAVGQRASFDRYLHLREWPQHTMGAQRYARSAFRHADGAMMTTTSDARGAAFLSAAVMAASGRSFASAPRFR